MTPNDLPAGATATAGSNAVDGDAPSVGDLAVRPLWVAFAAVTVPFLLEASVPLWVQYLPLVASGLLLGMPHGAVDHLVPARLGGVSTGRSVLAVGALYLVAGGAYLLVWSVAPAFATAAFVALTWFHWGQGDLYLLSAVTDGAYPRSTAHAALVVLTRGAMPMAVPLVAFPGQYRRVVADLVGLFGADPGALAWAFRPGTRVVVAALVATLAVATVARGLVGSGRDGAGARTDAVETALLVAYFASVPPVLAVGLYFCLWHSLRHVARLTALGGGPSRGVTRQFAGFARDAAPTTALALAALVGVYALVPVAPTGLGETVALYLVLVAALTLPHVVVVSWMDRRQGVW